MYREDQLHTVVITSYMLSSSVIASPQIHVRPNKKVSVFRVTGLKILGRVGTHIFLKYFLLKKKIFFCILKGNSPFKNA